jgi:hypothetical protein
MHLNRREEALAAAQVARQDAHAIGSQNDIQGAEALIEDIQDNTLDVSEETMLRMAQKTLQCAEVRANHFAGLLKCSDDTLCKMFDVRLVVIRSGVSLDYVGAVAQLLGYFPTEASVFVLRRLRVRRRAVFDFCFEALCYIAVQAEHVMRKDAARVLAMMLLDEPTIERIAYTWRTRLLGPSVVAPESYGMLAKSVERELEQLSPHLPTLLRFQAAPNHNERVEIENGMLKRLEGTPFVNDAATFNGAPVSKQGCGMMLFGIMMVAVILLYFFKIRR